MRVHGAIFVGACIAGLHVAIRPRGARDRVLYAKAQTLGLVSEDGYLTNAGYQLWRECEG